MASDHQRWKTLRQLDSWLDTPMMVLSAIWVVIVLVELTTGGSTLLTTLGTFIWIIFLVEFALRFVLAPKKIPFLKTNWLTAIALLAPALRLFAIFRFLRAASALRGFRLVRIVGTANRSMNALRRTLERRKFGYVAVLTLLVVGLGAAGMLSFEPASQVQGGFTSYGDALWWTAMLLTSIGSQYWPVTAEGRMLTVLLSLYGFATFGYITATFASYFVGRDAEKKDGPVAGAGELQQLTKEVRALRAEIERSRPAPPGS
ncbi:MAG TPA: ion transporter [Sphingomicrobium sp.]|nr:ion transporter [Sphingomicrobium sp.]